jgi:CheY-like chemotaxis protein
MQIVISHAAKKVLYVEDNPVNVFLVQAIFEPRPEIKLFIAPSGSVGLELAQQQRPNLILLDMNLPDMDGVEFLRKLRAEPTIAMIPVVVVSADNLSEQRTQCREFAVADYVSKPFDL